jgi:hypothetical protein
MFLLKAPFLPGDIPVYKIQVPSVLRPNYIIILNTNPVTGQGGSSGDALEATGNERGAGRRVLLQEDYYLRDADLGGNSQWCGEGARALGLEGAVGEEEFRALCRGGSPAATGSSPTS